MKRFYLTAVYNVPLIDLVTRGERANGSTIVGSLGFSVLLKDTLTCGRRSDPLPFPHCCCVFSGGVNPSRYLDGLSYDIISCVCVCVA